VEAAPRRLLHQPAPDERRLRAEHPEHANTIARRHHRTGSDRVSPSILSLLADQCSADELVHLAAAARQRRRSRLPREAAEELANMLAAGQKPALGWWRRWRPPPTEVPCGGPITAGEAMT